MTGPINFNIFSRILGPENKCDLDKDKKVDGQEQLPEIEDRRQSLRSPDIDMKIPDFSMNVGQDEDCELDLSAMDPQKMKKDMQ